MPSPKRFAVDRDPTREGLLYEPQGGEDLPLGGVAPRRTDAFYRAAFARGGWLMPPRIKAPDLIGRLGVAAIVVVTLLICGIAGTALLTPWL